MSHQAVASIKAADGTVNYCLRILSSLSLNDEDKLSFVIGNCLITFNKHIVCSLSPWISDILKDECWRLEGHVFISLPEETSLKGFLSLKAVIETGVTHELSNLDKDELSFAIKLLGMDIQLKKIVTVNECSSDEVDFDAQQHESIISTEDMFTHNVDMDSEQTRSVDDMEADDTNNNKTLEPRTSNGMEKNSDLNKDLEVFEEINMVNSMDNAQHNLNNMKPVFKKCEVRINRLNRKSFINMRNWRVKIKRLDRQFDKSLEHLKCTLKPLPSSQAMSGDVDTCFPQSSCSATPTQPDKEESRKINFSISDSLKSSRAIEEGAADIIVVPTPTDRNDAVISMVQTPTDRNDADISMVQTPTDRNDADISMVQTPIDRNNVQESSHSTVILYTANCDEFFSSFGHERTTDDGKETISHAHSEDDDEKIPSHAHSTDDWQDTANHAHSAADDKAFPGNARCAANGNGTQSTHFLTAIKVPNKSNPPQFDGSASNVSSNSVPQEYHGPVVEEILTKVDNGDSENGQKIHDGSLLPSTHDAEVASVTNPSLLGCSESFENNIEFSSDEEDVEKQIELVPKIKIKRNLIQWAT